MGHALQKKCLRKFSIFFGVVLQAILFGLINGEVEFCLEFDSENISENEGSLEKVPTLLKQAGEEIQNAIRESGLGAVTTNYDSFPLNFSHPAVTIDAVFENGTVVINNQTIRLWTIVDGGFEIFNLTLPYIFANGSYNGSGYVGAHRLFDIYGNGTFSLNMTNFSVSVVSGLKINSSALCIPLSVQVYVKEFESYFNDFMNADELLGPLLNRDIQSLVPDAVRIMFRESVDGVDPYIQAIIDQLLHESRTKTLSKLLYILASNKDQLESILKNA